MTPIYPCLWFDGEAAEAAAFYVSVFPNSKILATTHTTDAVAKASGHRKGSVLTVELTLDGQRVLALNGGPQFKFTEAISLTVECKDQKDVDHYWSSLSKGGQEGQCGWLKDKYG